MSTFSTLAVSRDEPAIARVVLSRPEARNAVNLAMCEELKACFDTLSAAPDVRVVVVSGKGPVFCAGADLKERKGHDESWVRARRLAAFAAYAAIERCPVPVFALIQGAAVGSGGEIALATDFVIMADKASFRFPEPQWGTVGATQRLQRAIGKRGAKELLFTGRAMEAQEALQRGLAQRVVASDALDGAGHDTAQAIAGSPALAMRLTKQAVDLGAQTDLESGVRIELAAIDHNLAAGDWRGGQDKFAKAMVSKKHK